MSEVRTDGFRGFFDKTSVIGVAVVLMAAGIGGLFASPYSNVAVLGSFAVMLVFTFLRREGFKKLGFRGQSNWLRLIMLAAVFGVVFECVSSILFEPFVAEWLGEEVDLSAFAALEGSIANTAIMLAVGWVVGGFLEEMLFRGFLLQGIERLLGGSAIATVAGVVGSSVLFGLPHYYQDTVGMIMTGLMGFVLALVYVWSGRNLWFTVLIHGFVDTFGITLLYFGKYDDLRSLIFS